MVTKFTQVTLLTANAIGEISIDPILLTGELTLDEVIEHLLVACPLGSTDGDRLVVYNNRAFYLDN